MSSQRSILSRIGVTLLAIIVAIGVTLFISYSVFGGQSLEVMLEAMQSTADYQNILLVNVLVGISVALFVSELRWSALRVTLTVAFALLLGFFVTTFFNLDTANRHIQGQFTVALRSDAEPIENEEVDLRYGIQRGDEFNKPNARNPVKEAEYTFEGRQGDVVTILAAAANRRSTVNLQTSLIDADGNVLATATEATEAQYEAYEDDLQSTKDAVIENFTLPADGIYTIHTTPEPLETSLVLSEALESTQNAYQSLLGGPIQRVNRWAVWIQDALSLILVGLAISIAFRARQFSLGAEGQIYFGALVSGAVILGVGSELPAFLLLPLALLSAMTVGFLWGLLPGALKAYLGADELVATLMLNAIATRFYDVVLTFQLKPASAGYITSDSFPIAGILPVIIKDTQVTIAVFLVIIAVIATWLLLTRTPLGYEIRMIGTNIRFADYGGVNTRRAIMLSMAVSGIIAGLAGAHLAMGIHRQLILNISVGLAFEGVVVALLARNNPLVIPFTGLLYAYLRTGAQFMERDANVSFEVVRIIQAVIILLITAEALVAFFQNRRTLRQATEHHDNDSAAQITATEEKARV